MNKKVLDFKDRCHLLKNHLQQHNLFRFPQLTALIISNEIQVDKVPIALFCNVFDAVLQDFLKTLRLVAFPHLVETESAPMDLQMELLEIKNCFFF